MDDRRLENALNTLLENSARSDGRLAGIEERAGRIESNMATKADLAELRHAVTHYSKYVEGMLNSFAGSTLSLEARVAELQQRIEALEKRLPPQAA